MALDQKEKSELRALVSNEIHKVLQREMAQLWAESLLLATMTNPSGGVGQATGVTGTPVGSNPQPSGSTGKPGGNSPQPQPSGSMGVPGGHINQGINIQYLSGVADVLFNTQATLTQELRQGIDELMTALQEFSRQIQDFEAKLQAAKQHTR